MCANSPAQPTVSRRRHASGVSGGSEKMNRGPIARGRASGTPMATRPIWPGGYRTRHRPDRNDAGGRTTPHMLDICTGVPFAPRGGKRCVLCQRLPSTTTHIVGTKLPKRARIVYAVSLAAVRRFSIRVNQQILRRGDWAGVGPVVSPGTCTTQQIYTEPVTSVCSSDIHNLTDKASHLSVLTEPLQPVWPALRHTSERNRVGLAGSCQTAPRYLWRPRNLRSHVGGVFKSALERVQARRSLMSATRSIRPPRFEQMRDVPGVRRVAPFRDCDSLVQIESVVPHVRHRSLSLTGVEVQSALPDLNGGQVDLQSTALPV